MKSIRKIKKKKLIESSILTLTIIIVGVIFLKYKIYSKNSNSNSVALNDEEKIVKGTYETALNMFKEVMQAYYRKGIYIQYNFPKAVNVYGKYAPEEATTQERQYSVCANFTYSVLSEAFGMEKNKTTNFVPKYNYDISNYAHEYYLNNKGTSKLDGNLLVYYQTIPSSSSSIEDISYLYGTTPSSDRYFDFDYFVSLIKPGDLFVYSGPNGGHALMAYDVRYNPSIGKNDVLIINSTGSSKIYSKVTGTPSLYYDNKFDGYFNDELSISRKGSIKLKWLSDITNFTTTKNGKQSIKCHRVTGSTLEECAVLRVVYSDKKGNAVFNAPIKEENYNRSFLRTKYKALKIEKTSNKGDNNVVTVGDTIKYTIKITNESKSIYKAFKVDETFGDLVDYVSSTGKRNWNTITWNVSSLGAGSSVELVYTVKVKSLKENIAKSISSTGKFYSTIFSDVPSEANIPTGTVKHKIVNITPKTTKTYKECFDKASKSYKGRPLLDAVYSCVYGNKYKFNFKNLELNKLMTTQLGSNSTKSSSNAVTLSTIEETSEYGIFQSMILNNYWNGLAKYTDDNNKVISIFPAWSTGKKTATFRDANARAKNINSSDFKDGDILMYSVNSPYYTTSSGSKINYSREAGIYSYIYIDGKFVGVNHPDSQYGNRNEFTFKGYGYYTGLSEEKLNKAFYKGYSDNKNDTSLLNYINYQTLFSKDYYVILRPSLYIGKDLTPPKYVAPANDDKDKVSPNYSVDVNYGTKYHQGYTFTVKLSDSGGLAAGKYTFKYAWSTKAIGCSKMTDSVTLNVSDGDKSVSEKVVIRKKTGLGRIYVCNENKIKDKAGNSISANTKKSAIMYFDNSGPTLSVSVSKAQTYQKGHVARIKLSDQYTGLAAGSYVIRYGWLSSKPKSCDDLKSTTKIVVSEDKAGVKSAFTKITINKKSGNNKIYVCNDSTVKDVMGNTLKAKTKIASDYLYLDNEAPTMSTIKSDNKITFKLEDKRAGLKPGKYVIKYAWSKTKVECKNMKQSVTITVNSVVKTAKSKTITISNKTGKGKLYYCNDSQIIDNTSNKLSKNTKKSITMNFD